MSVLESKIQGDICKYLEKCGYFFWRSNNMPTHDPKMNSGYGGYRAQGRYAQPGLSDICMLVDGTFIAIEVKAAKGRQSADQLMFEKRVKANGGEYYTVRSVEEVKSLGL